MKTFIIIVSILFINFSNAQISDFKDIDFTRADNIAKLNNGESLNNLAILSHKLTSKLPTKVEKFRAIYTWVCMNIKGDLTQHNKVARMRNKFKNDSTNLIEWNEKYQKVAFKKLLKYKKTMCTGYAYLIKELAFLADIECEIVNGFGRTIDSNVNELDILDHSWNAVKLNNKWYLCDATWSSGFINENNSFVKDYNDGYFLTDPCLFSKDHFPIDKKWLLNSQVTSETFVTSPLVYAEAFRLKVFPLSPAKMNTKVRRNKEIDFEFIAPKNVSLDKISLVHYVKNNEESFPVFDIENKGKTIQFKTKFKRFGFYDLHLKVGNDIVTTYTIEVSNR
jgi:transglutaminase/protease-like cytokinesis protein 3